MPAVRHETRPWVPAFSEEFIARARGLFADAPHVTIVGPLGSGRGDLAREVAGPAASAAWGRGSHEVALEHQPYAVLNQLVPPLRASPIEEVDAVVHRAGQLVGNISSPPVFVLHEVELCDSATLDVLSALVATGSIRLVSTIGPAAAADHRFALHAARIDLPPLTDDTIGDLLAERFGAAPHPTTIRMLAERSQGAYAILRRLADAAYEAGELKILAGVLVIDTGVASTQSDTVAMGTQRWAPRFSGTFGSRDLVDVSALCLDLDAEEALAVFGHASVAEALHIGAVRRDGGTLTFTSRVEAELLRRSLEPARRAELFEHYGHQLSRTFEGTASAPWVAGWFQSVGEALTPDLAVRAVSVANRQGRYSLAVELADVVPRADWPSRLQVEVAHALAESGARAETAALIATIEPAELTDVDLFVFLRIAGRTLPADELSPLVDRISATDDPDHQSTVALHALSVRCQDEGSTDIGRALNSLVFSGRLSAENHAMALAIHAMHLRNISETGRARTLVDEAVQLLEELPLVATANLEIAREVQIFTLLTDADYAAAQTALTAYSRPAARYGNVGRLGTALWGISSFYSGNLSTALAHVTLCLARMPADDTHQLRGWVEAVTAQILVQIGSIDEATELLAMSADRPPHPRRQPDMERRLTRALALDSMGEPEEALDILQAMIGEAREHELRLQQVDAAALCVQIGGPQHLPQLLEATEHVGDDCGTSTIWKRFGAAIDANDMPALAELAIDLDTDNRRLFGAEVAQFTLDIARRASDMTPETRIELQRIANPMGHRSVSRPPSERPSDGANHGHQRHDD